MKQPALPILLVWLIAASICPHAAAAAPQWILPEANAPRVQRVRFDTKAAHQEVRSYVTVAK
jgi:hypothetical protein